LKGLLGIRPDIGSTADVQNAKETTNERKNETSSKNKKKKKKTNNTASSNKIDANQRNQSHENKTKGSKAHQSGNTAADQKQRKKGDNIAANKSTENFALSAFQSPPDPSTLPLPSFHSHDEDNGSNSTLADIQVNNESSIQSQTEESKIASEPISTNTSSTEKVKSFFNVSNISVSDQLKNTNGSGEILTNGERQPTGDECSSDEVYGNKTSQSGVNLALLAMKGSETQRTSLSSHKQSEVNLRPPNVELDPIAVLLQGESYGVNNPALSHSQMIHPQHPQFLPQQYGYMHPNYDTFNPYPMQPMYHPHQSFTTIQVQVPPVLLPGNQMLLHASPLTGGYPLPITLPENAQPGMIIPITIPCLATPPYPYMNMNMAPSPPPQMNYYNQSPYNSSLQSQAYPTDVDGNLAQTRSKSWAERVAEQSKSADTNKTTRKA
jgi:hypothetical protein